MAKLPSKPVSVGIAAALALSVPLIGEFEGLRLDPYRDIAGIPTVCYGETRVEMRRYTKEECVAMLREATAQFSDGVLKITPGLATRPYQLAAATSLAYNIGIEGYRTSSVARMFNQGYWRQGCYNFLKWNKVRKNGKLVVSKGLDNRRKKEMEVCLVDANLV